LAIAKTLDILLRAPTSKLDADFKKGQQMFSGFVSTIKGLAGPLLAAVSLGGFVSQINKALTSIDELSKRSVRLNIDIADLRGLQLAADLSGVALGEIEVGARTLTKQVDALSKGSARQVELFKELGLTATDVLDKSLSEQLAAVGTGLGGIESVTRRSAIALELFGRNGNKLLPLLANNAQAVRDAMSDIQRLGAPISAADGAAVEKSNDAFTRLMFTFDSIFQTVSVAMAPALERLYVNLAEAIRPGTALNQMFLSLGQVMTLAVNVVNELVGFISFMSEGMGTLTGRFLAGVVVATALISVYKGLIVLLGLLRARTAALAIWEAARAAINIKTAAILLAAGGAAVAFAEQINGAVNSLMGLMDAQVNVNKGIEDFIDLKAKSDRKSLNLGSATFGSQAALEQLFTVKGERQAMKGIENGVKESNDLLRAIRDGINAAEGAINVDVEEVDI
jgi:hypothetical protein